MYGLEDEYIDSTLNVIPRSPVYRGQRSIIHDRKRGDGFCHCRTCDALEGDRLSMIYDFGTPSHYYCIVKEVYSGDEIENFLKEREPIATTETAAIIDEKRP